MLKNYLYRSIAILVLPLALSARASAETADFNPLGTWVGSYQPSEGSRRDDSRIVIRRDGEDGWTGDWDGLPIEDLTVAGDTAHWQHLLPDGRYCDVTATLVGGELRVLYVLHEGPAIFCGSVIGPGEELGHGEGVFRLHD